MSKKSFKKFHKKSQDEFRIPGVFYLVGGIYEEIFGLRTNSYIQKDGKQIPNFCNFSSVFEGNSREKPIEIPGVSSDAILEINHLSIPGGTPVEIPK